MAFGNKKVWLGGTAVVVVAIGGYVYANFNSLAPTAAMALNYFRYLNAPAGTLTTEMAPGAANIPLVKREVADTGKDWPSYNKTLKSDRYSSLDQINRDNAGQMKEICTYDTGEYTGFNTGIIEVNGSLLFASEHNLYSIDPNTCKLKWKAHESYTPASPQDVNRGPAYLDGKVFRGTQDGRVIAYDFNTGKRLWATTIANYKKGESAPAAPIAWNGMVFIGNAGGDVKGVKGRMYGLDANTGKIVWEFYMVPREPGDKQYGPEAASPLDGSTWHMAKGEPITGGATWTSYTLDPDTGLLYVPGGNPAPDFDAAMRKGEDLYSGSVVVLDAKTGAYKKHFKVVHTDWHDYDVSATPILIKTAAGKDLMSIAPKDGHLYGYNLADDQQLYRLPVTKIENATEPFVVGKPVRFCPGTIGGTEWNGPGYDPQNNLIMVGSVEWCTTAEMAPPSSIGAEPMGSAWGGEDSKNPFNTWGKQDPVFQWAGWVHAVDADTGQWRWRVKTNYPVQSGMTPTAGGVVFFGDMGGNLYTLDSNSGQKLWGKKIGGAVGGGVITYDAGQGQRVAAATGLIEILWPTEITTAKVSVFGLPG